MKKPLSAVSDRDPLGDELDKLATDLAKELQAGGAMVEEKIAGLRALTAYYAMKNKLPPPPDETKGKFGGFGEMVKTHRNGAKLNDF